MNKENLKQAIKDMANAHDAYECAIENAHSAYHNYEEWDHEQWEPINEALNDFKVAKELAMKLLEELSEVF